MEYYSSRHTVDLDDAKKTLEKYGVCIIPDVLTPEECAASLDNMWIMLEQMSAKWDVPIDRTDPNTHDLSYVIPVRHMLIQHTISHCEFPWAIRQNPSVVNVFKTLWNCEDLVTSFDGVSVHFPPERNGKGWHKGDDNGGWLHCDQSFSNEELECYQSWVTPVDVNKGDATLVYLEKSHLYHAEFAKTIDKEGKGKLPAWRKLTAEEISVYTDTYGCKIRKVICPAGSMVIWDSRVIHCGQQAMKSREQPNIRSCVYVCMVPRSLCTKANKRKRKLYYETQRTTNHNAAAPKVFPKTPYTRGAYFSIVRPPRAELTELGKSLI